jgi:plasmid maintenance system antidote protein VapI
MALRLAEAFYTTANLWITMQRNYDLYMVMQKFTPKGVVKKVYTNPI